MEKNKIIEPKTFTGHLSFPDSHDDGCPAYFADCTLCNLQLLAFTSHSTHAQVQRVQCFLWNFEYVATHQTEKETYIHVVESCDKMASVCNGKRARTVNCL